MNKHSSVPYVLLIDIEDKLAEIIYEYDAIELTQALAKSVIINKGCIKGKYRLSL